jgi:glycosyltransferase involved in cell wall biosynthesis
VAADSDARIRVMLLMDSLPVGGAESLLLSVLSGLDRDRFAAEVLCIRSAGEMAPRFVQAGVPVYVLGSRRAQHLTTPTRLVSWLRTRRVDVLMLTSHHAAQFFGPTAAKLAGVPATVVSVHMTGGKSIGLPTLPRIGIEQLALVDALVAVSHEQLEYLASEEGLSSRPWRSTRTEVIPNGVSTEPRPGVQERYAARESLGIAADDEAVGILAALRSEKAHDVFLRAGALVVARRPRARLVLIGDGERRAELEALAAELGLADRTIFAGYRPDARALIPALDVTCLTSVQETFPIAPLESLEAGVPVVMTDCGNMGRFIDEGTTGHLVPVGDHDALAERVTGLLDDPARRRRYGDAGREAVHTRFSLEATVSAYERLFADLVGPAR